MRRPLPRRVSAWEAIADPGDRYVHHWRASQRRPRLLTRTPPPKRESIPGVLPATLVLMTDDPSTDTRILTFRVSRRDLEATDPRGRVLFEATPPPDRPRRGGYGLLGSW